MKFFIFKWWEAKWVKIVIIIGILILGFLFILGFYHFDDKGNYTFSTSIWYAMIIFIFSAFLSKIDIYSSSKLYERETYYLTLKRLREAVNSTILDVDGNEIEQLRNNIILFQSFTGRTTEIIKAKLQGKNIPIYIKENGFIYKSDMKKLEDKFLTLYDEGKKNELNELKHYMVELYLNW